MRLDMSSTFSLSPFTEKAKFRSSPLMPQRRIPTSTYKLLDSFSEGHRYTGLDKNFVQGETLNELFGQHNTSFDSASRSEIHTTLKRSENLGFLFFSCNLILTSWPSGCNNMSTSGLQCQKLYENSVLLLNGAANVSVHLFEMLF